MTRYKITITFNQTTTPLSGDVLRIVNQTGSELFYFKFFIFEDDTSGFTNPVEAVVGIGSATNYNFNASVISYYGSQGYAIATDILKTTIEGDFDSEPALGAVLPTGITFSVSEVVDPLSIIGILTAPASANQCIQHDIEIHATREFTEILKPIQATFPPTTTYTVHNIQRTATASYVQVEVSDGTIPHATKTFNTLSILNSGVIDITITGNTVVVNRYTFGLILQMSLDGTSWQYTNTFNNLSKGDYTLYVKDQLGCTIQMPFEIDEGVDGVITIPEPYFFYSKANSIRMAKREQWDDYLIHKNSLNTLSCEVIDEVKHTEKQYYEDREVVTLQFKNNYDDLEVITSDDGLIQPLVQKSNNIGIKKSMDCSVADLGDSKYGIYFMSGDTYSYDTGDNLNEPYVLNGELPQFGKIGQIITIGGINYTVEDISFNEQLNVEQLIISSSSLSGVTTSICKAIYNIFDYEIYEVAIAMIGRAKLNIQVSYDGTLQWVSELILVGYENEQLIHLAWSMHYNTDMFFATGIIPHARLLVDTIKAAVSNEGESYETDSDSILIDSDNFEVDIFRFLPVTKEMARYLVLWLSHSELSIRGVGYRKESIELEALERSNLYVVTATLIVRGSGLYEDRIGTSSVEIVELIKTESDEYIKIN